MNNEFRVLGPPGTGKTTYLARQIERAASKFGSSNIVVASYTRAAAAVLNRRDLPIPRENIGTLHALCYRALKERGYEIAEVNAASFNEEHEGDAITLASQNMDEMAVDANFVTDGDKHLNTYNLYRAKCLDLSTMPRDTIRWVKLWESWKFRRNVIDFTDMITITLDTQIPLEGDPLVGFYDEAQDFNKLELQLVRHWARNQDHVILSGDDDQTIYSFAGSSPDAFLDGNIADDHVRVLDQSWRLPKKIHDYSQRWIKQLKNRVPKEFKPRDVEGMVGTVDATYKDPEKVVELAAKYAQDGKTVMILTSCGYLLNPVKSCLRANGLTFHNPYRASRGDWNPMGRFHANVGNGKTTTRERILAFFDKYGDTVNDSYWSLDDLVKWLDIVRVRGVLKKGARAILDERIENKNLYVPDKKEFYQQLFEPFALEKALQRDVLWFREVLLSAKRNVAEYPLNIYQKHGRQTLEERPRIIVGTIHSVKGAEADVTIIFPDLSIAAMKEYEKTKDSIIRTFYVGITRSRESLIICKPASGACVPLRY